MAYSRLAEAMAQRYGPVASSFQAPSPLAKAMSPEEEYLQSMSPVDAYKFQVEAHNARKYTPEQANANLQQTGMDLLYASPLGNALSARDAMESKWQAQDLERQGDLEGARRAYANAASSAGMAFLPGMGRIGAGQAANSAAKEGKSTLAAIMAYHGSPHDFDRFDMKNIGKGEGAQAYGHGLYFAENRKVAREYEGALARNGNDPAVMAREALHEAGGDPQKAIESLRKQQVGLDQVAQTMQHSGDPTFGWTADAGRQAIQFVENHAKGEKLPLPASGRLYKTELDVDHHQLLDWDKPLSEQSPEVRKALENIAHKPKPNYDFEGNLKSPDDLTGENYYQGLAQTLGRPFDPGNLRMSEWANHEAATQALREAGIPGIRYLDQGSRGGAGDASHNIVIFDDKLAKILNKE